MRGAAAVGAIGHELGGRARSGTEVEVVGAYTSWMVGAGGVSGAGPERPVSEHPGDSAGGCERPVDAHLWCLVSVDRAEPQMMLTGAVNQRLEPFS